MKTWPIYLVTGALLVGVFGVCAGGELLRVGAYENPPKVFTSPDGRTTGLFPEVLEAIAREHEWDIRYLHGTWNENLERLRAGEIDLMLDVAVSEERAEDFAFANESVLVNWGTVYAREGFPIRTFRIRIPDAA